MPGDARGQANLRSGSAPLPTCSWEATSLSLKQVAAALLVQVCALGSEPKGSPALWGWTGRLSLPDCCQVQFSVQVQPGYACAL